MERKRRISPWDLLRLPCMLGGAYGIGLMLFVVEWIVFPNSAGRFSMLGMILLAGYGIWRGFKSTRHAGRVSWWFASACIFFATGWIIFSGHLPVSTGWSFQ